MYIISFLVTSVLLYNCRCFNKGDYETIVENVDEKVKSLPLSDQEEGKVREIVAQKEEMVEKPKVVKNFTIVKEKVEVVRKNKKGSCCSI